MSSLKATRNLEHQVLKKINEHELGGKKILLALSGGLDSVALFHVLRKVHGQFSAAYFHHGEGGNQEYRRQAQEFCETLTAKYSIPFVALKAETLLNSESEFRDARYRAFERLMTEQRAEVLALAHHADDLLETRLLRLVRGTGAQGLGAMTTLKNKKFRPFLGVSKAELFNYLQEEGLEAFVEDPTNQDLDPLRNWLRGEWLPALEQKQTGAVQSLARSLQILAESVSENETTTDLLHENELYKSQSVEASAISRAYFLTLGPQNQRRLLAQYLFSLGKRNFSQSQLEEVCKRLDNPQRVITFEVAGCLWMINAEQFKIQE